MDLEPCSKVYNLVSVYLKRIKLGQMTNLNVIFQVVVSVYRLVKIRNSPQFPDEFRNGLYPLYTNNFFVGLYFTITHSHRPVKGLRVYETLESESLPR